MIRRVGGRAEATPALFDLPALKTLQPKHSAVDALNAAIAFLEARRVISDFPPINVVQHHRGGHLIDQSGFLHILDGFRDEVALHLEVFPESPARVRLAWVMDFVLADDRQFHGVVGASGRQPRVLLLAQTNTCAFQGTWSLGAMESRTDACPLPLLARPAGSTATASTWDDGSGKANGPNALCRVGGSSQLEQIGDAEVDNVFIWCNRLHDLFAAFGFTANQFALEGNDPLIIRRFPSSDQRVAEYDNAIDGLRATMRLWASSHAGGVHSAADPSIVIHEYAHALSSRLIGGSTIAKPFLLPESKGVSEGLSDFFALTVLNFARRQDGLGGDQEIVGAVFKPPNGLRRYDATQPHLFDPAWTDKESKKYAMGGALCVGLLDARDAIAAMSGDNDADRFMWSACIDALRSLGPTNGPFLDVTLSSITAAILSAAQRVENVSPGLSGATAEIDNAFAAHNL